ncbi:hypothetical protein Taro_004223, partial [Colocasia esculenta]|nr:hypothetical protein [Colocasia esculenta]
VLVAPLRWRAPKPPTLPPSSTGILTPSTSMWLRSPTATIFSNPSPLSCSLPGPRLLPLAPALPLSLTGSPPSTPSPSSCSSLASRSLPPAPALSQPQLDHLRRPHRRRHAHHLLRDRCHQHPPYLQPQLDHLRLPPIYVVMLITYSTIDATGTRLTSSLNWITFVISVAIIAFIIVTGSAHVDLSNRSISSPTMHRGCSRRSTKGTRASTWWPPWRRRLRPSPRHLPWPDRLNDGHNNRLLRHGICALLNAEVLIARPRHGLLGGVRDGGHALGQVHLATLYTLKGMTTGMLISLIQPQTGTPVNATIFVTSASVCIALFSSLDVLATVSSINTLFIFMLMVVALLIRRYDVHEALVPLLRCVVVLITCSTMTMTRSTKVIQLRQEVRRVPIAAIAEQVMSTTTMTGSRRL